MGVNAAQASGAAMQNRYDMGYVQCMYANGNSLPMTGRQVPSYGAYPYWPYAGPRYRGYYYRSYPRYYY